MRTSKPPETLLLKRLLDGQADARPGAQKNLLALEYIVDELSDIYEPEEARLWFSSRQKLLGGSSPADLIQEGKADALIDAIERLKAGVFI